MGRCSGARVPNPERTGQVLSFQLILRLPDGDKEFVLRTDASDVGIGGVLMQRHEEGLFPVQFASRKLHARERAYPIFERECLAIIWAIKKFDYFLHGRKFRIVTKCHFFFSLQTLLRKHFLRRKNENIHLHNGPDCLMDSPEKWRLKTYPGNNLII